MTWKHVGTKTIETTRLLLRRLKLTDAEMMIGSKHTKWFVCEIEDYINSKFLEVS